MTREQELREDVSRLLTQNTEFRQEIERLRAALKSIAYMPSTGDSVNMVAFLQVTAATYLIPRLGDFQGQG